MRQTCSNLTLNRGGGVPGRFVSNLPPCLAYFKTNLRNNSQKIFKI
ncbi:hypothetical protein CAMRE0001_0230 [Campylobacter rectus RM3267]|uniref:Uncharacterized protein n=1 Tax=Campylobacter rectus RM3267 TaxID=553218 RepID=B9CY35_CAMRE|nr:hypothetical protein CAMRE0001_0230 [Campylobacter rectus RM3267]